MRSLIALLILMPMTANAAEVCRSYAVNFETEPGSVITISADGVLVQDEDISEEAICVGKVCADSYGSFIINEEVPGKYAIINGVRADAICDQ